MWHVGTRRWEPKWAGPVFGLPFVMFCVLTQLWTLAIDTREIASGVSLAPLAMKLLKVVLVTFEFNAS